MYNTFHFHKIILVLFTLVTSTLVQAQQSYTQLVANNQLTEVANTLSLKSDDSALETINNLQWSQNEKKSALLLNKLGCLTITDISQSNQSTDVVRTDFAPRMRIALLARLATLLLVDLRDLLG